ncbi:MAG: hypothetical protein RIS70_3386 [Planctomycetota bacterium]
MIETHSTPRRISAGFAPAHRVLLLIAACVASCGRTALANPPSILESFFNRPNAAVVTEVPHPSVARITSIEGNVQSLGSGTLIDVRDRYGLVITNWHVIRDAKGDVLVTFPNGFQSKAQILQVDQDWDLAALVIWRPELMPVPLTTVAPQPGDRLIIAGYGSGKYRAVQGRCTQYVSPSPRLPHEMIELSAEARQGDSGGPIFNDRGELAGVLFGAGGGTTAGSWAGRVRLFLGPLGASLGQAASAAPTDATNPAFDALAAGTNNPAPTWQASNASSTTNAVNTNNALNVAADGLRPASNIPNPTPDERSPSQAQVAPTTSGQSMALASLPRQPGSQSGSFEASGDRSFATNDLVPVPPTADPAASEEKALPTPSLVGATTESFSDRRRNTADAEKMHGWNLHSFTGTTVYEQAKTALALVGLLSFLYQIRRMTRSGD